MTITRGLTTLKLLDKRINKAITGGQFANYTVGGKEQFQDIDPNASFQSVDDLINYRSKLKAAIMESNAKTIVKIGNKKMTVVEAIETKDSIKYRKDLLRKIMSDMRNVRGTVENINEDVAERLDRMLQANFSKDGKVTEKDIEAVSKPFLKQNEAKEVENKKFYEKVENLEEEIDTFEAEVDLVLSESNATATIEI